MVPSFFIIGAPKCGTTSLAGWLADHPRVFMSPWKEPRYFDRDLRTRMRIGSREYGSLFRGAAEDHLAVGEATVWYLFSSQAVPNIERELSGSRYVVMIRNPVDMASSLHEQMSLHQVEHITDFADAWEHSPVRRAGKGVRRWVVEPRLLDYQHVCRLGEQLERLYDRVPEERVLVLILDDIKADPRREYLRVLEFLGLPDDQRVSFPARNPAKRVRWQGLQLGIVFGMKAERVIRGRLGLPPVHSRLLRALNDLNKTPRQRPAMEPTLRARLTEYFAEDMHRLERLLGRELSAWTAPNA